MFNLENQKEKFKNHKATFTNYGNIKILDFQEPGTSNYRIRFLFEEDYYRLHISGDLGELIASNYYNMVYEKFASDYVNNIGYFKEKIDCHSRPIYSYCEEDAEADLREYLQEHNLVEDILQHNRTATNGKQMRTNGMSFLKMYLKIFRKMMVLAPMAMM